MEVFHTSWKDLFKNTDIKKYLQLYIKSLGNAKVVKNCTLYLLLPFFFFFYTTEVLQKAYCNHMAAANLQSHRF